MMILSDLHPDRALKKILENKVAIDISSLETRIASIYCQGERPNTDLEDEFIEVLFNGTIRAMAHPLGVYKGNLAITLYCKSQSNGVSKLNRIDSMVKQVEALINYKSKDNIYFEINPNNVITPIIYNEATGYTTMTLNVEFKSTR